MSLLEHVHRAGLPSVAVVMDDWPTYGPRVDGWQAPLYAASAPRSAGGAVYGHPYARATCGSRTSWVFISRHQLERTERSIGTLPGAQVAHAGVDDGPVPAGAGACVAMAAPLLRPDRPAQGDRPGRGVPAASAGRGRRYSSWATATPSTARELERLAQRRWACRSACGSSGSSATGSPTRSPSTTCCCSRSGGRSRGASCRSRRWPSGCSSLRAGAAARREYFERRRELPAGGPGRGPGGAGRRAAAAGGRRRAPRAGCARAGSRPPSAIPTPRSRTPWRDAAAETASRRLSAEVTVAVVSWNTRDLLERCLRSLEPDVAVRAGRRLGRGQRIERRLAGARARAVRVGDARRARREPGLRAPRSTWSRSGATRPGSRPRTPTSSSSPVRSSDCLPRPARPVRTRSLRA